MINEVYEVFDVDQHASVEEIKKSYSNLVRKHKKNVETFMFVREARDMLCEPATREIYDSLLRVIKLLKAYKEKKSNSNWENAITILKRISLEKPNKGDIQQIRNSFPLLSKKINISKLEYTIEDGLIQGQIYKCQANLLAAGDFARIELYQSARDHFEQVILCDKLNPQGYVEIAEIYLKESKYAEAITWTRKAVLADEKIDYQDLEALHLLCHIYAISKELQKVEEIIPEIIALLPDQEAKVNASLKFTESGDAFYQAAFEQLDFLKQSDFSTQSYLFSASLVFKKAAKLFNPDDGEIVKQCNKLENFLEALSQLQTIRNNSLFPENSQKVIAISLFSYVNTDESNVDLINSVVASSIKSSEMPIPELVDRLKSQDSKIYELNKVFFEQLQTIAQEPEKRRGKLPTNTSGLLNKINYQDFVEIVKSRYSQRSDILKEGADHLSAILEPMTEKIMDEYENLQLGGLEYQDLAEKIRSRSSQDTALLRGGINRALKGLHAFLDPIAEQVMLTYPRSERFVSPLMEKLSDFLLEEVD